MASDLFKIIEKCSLHAFCPRTLKRLRSESSYPVGNRALRFLNWLHFIIDCDLIGIDEFAFFADSITYTDYYSPCDNIPPASMYNKVVANVKEIKNLMNKFYSYHGEFKINSWYRNESVNLSVGGTRYSRHMLGAAVDLSPTSISDYNRFKCNVASFVRNNPIIKAIYYDDRYFIHLELINPVVK